MVKLIKMTTAEEVIKMMTDERDIARKVIESIAEYVESDDANHADKIMYAAIVGRETTLDQMISEANGVEWVGSDAN